MGKFKVGDRVRYKHGMKSYNGIVVEVNSGVYKNSTLCRLDNFVGHNGNNSTNNGKNYETLDHWYCCDCDLELIEYMEKDNDGEKVIMYNIGKVGDIRTGSKVVVVPQEKAAPLIIECKTVIATIDGKDYEAVCMPGDKFKIEDGVKAIVTKVIFGGQTEYEKLIRSLVKTYNDCEKKRKEEARIAAKKEKNAASKKARLERKVNAERQTRVDEMSEAFLKALQTYDGIKNADILKMYEYLTGTPVICDEDDLK